MPFLWQAPEAASNDLVHSMCTRILEVPREWMSLVSHPKHSTTVQSSDSLHCTRNPLPKLTALLPAILPLPQCHFLPDAMPCTSFLPSCPEPSHYFGQTRDKGVTGHHVFAQSTCPITPLYQDSTARIPLDDHFFVCRTVGVHCLS